MFQTGTNVPQILLLKASHVIIFIVVTSLCATSTSVQFIVINNLCNIVLVLVIFAFCVGVILVRIEIYPLRLVCLSPADANDGDVDHKQYQQGSTTKSTGY